MALPVSEHPLLNHRISRAGPPPDSTMETWPRGAAGAMQSVFGLALAAALDSASWHSF